MRALTWLLSFAAELWTRRRHACHHDYDTRVSPMRLERTRRLELLMRDYVAMASVALVVVVVLALLHVI